MAIRSDFSTFAGLEIGDTLIRRRDTAKYGTALRRVRNMLGLVGGGVRKRTGFLFGAVSADSSKRSRLIPFQFSTEQGYALEITDQKMRVFFQGFPVVETELAISSISNGNPAEVEAVAHGYVTGDQVYIDGQAGMVEVNGRTFTITVLDADTFTLNGVNATAYGAWTGNVGGVAGDVAGGEGGNPSGGPVIPAEQPAFEDFTPTPDDQFAVLLSQFSGTYGYPPNDFAIAFMGTFGRVPSFLELYPELAGSGFGL